MRNKLGLKSCARSPWLINPPENLQNDSKYGWLNPNMQQRARAVFFLIETGLDNRSSWCCRARLLWVPNLSFKTGNLNLASDVNSPLICMVVKLSGEVCNIRNECLNAGSNFSGKNKLRVGDETMMMDKCSTTSLFNFSCRSLVSWTNLKQHELF